MKYLLATLACIASIILHAQAYSAVSTEDLLDSASASYQKSEIGKTGILLSEIVTRLDSSSPKEQWFTYYRILGSNSFEMSNIPEAQLALKKAFKLARQLQDSFKIAKTSSEIANTYILTGEFQKALDQYNIALQYYPAKDDSYNSTLMNMSQAYRGLNEYNKALSQLMKSRKIYSQSGDYQNLAISENNIGEIYRVNIKDHKKAQSHYHRAAAANLKVNNKAGLAQNYHNLSSLFLDKAQPDSALFYAQLSKKLKEETGDEGGLASANHNLGSVYYLMGEYAKAIEYFTKSLEQSKKFQLMEGFYHNNIRLGQVYFELKEYQKSKEYLQQALNIAKQAGQLDLMADVYNALYEVYKKQGNSTQALHYFEKAQTLSDSIAVIQSDQHLAELHTRYEADLAEAENLVLREKNNLQEVEYQNQRMLLYLSAASSLLLLIVGVLLVRSLKQRNQALAGEKRSNAELARQYQKIKESEEKLEQANTLKNKILSVLGHDLRSPLNSISGLLSIIEMSDEISPEELKELLSDLKKEMDVSLATLEEILAWARLQMDEKGKMLQEINAAAFMEDILAIYEPQIRAKELTINVQANPETSLWADRNQMRSIMGNLFSNAIKFSPENEAITIHFEEKDNHSKITLTDRGRGISAEVLKNLNQRNVLISENGTSGERGTGIGLRIVKDFIEDHNGTLHFAVNEFGGTTVTVLIPKAEAEVFTY